MAFNPEGYCSRADLTAALSDLRQLSGLSLRQLAQKVDAPLSTVGGYFSGQHLPTTAQTELFRRILLVLGVGADELDGWILAAARLRKVQPATPERVPYRGLQTFESEHAAAFFGREALTEQLAEAARKGGLLAVVGASGSGKSSLLRAGLIPRLRASGWTCALMTPGTDGITKLCGALSATEPATVRKPISQGRSAGPASAPSQLPQPEFEDLIALAVGVPSPLLIVVDQFEECLGGEDTELALLGVLNQIVDRRDQPTAVVLGFRSDFYTRAAQNPDLLAVLQDRQILVGAMALTEMRRVITEPAKAVGLAVDADLVELLLRDLAPRNAHRRALETGSLPLLSHALRETALRAKRGRLSAADYLATGGVEGSVQQAAEQIFSLLDAEAQLQAKRVFLGMVNLSEDATVTRSSISVASADAASTTMAILKPFIERRLVMIDGDRAQITHEALLSAWNRLHQWVESDLANLQLRRQVRAMSALWGEADQDPGTLLRGERLANVLAWADGLESGELESTETAYLQASRTADLVDRVERQRRLRRLRQLVAVAVVLAFLAGAAALVAFQSRGEAEAAKVQATEARDRALSRQLAGNAVQLRATDPALAAQLSLLAWQTSQTVEARSALLDSTASGLPTRLLGPAGPTVAVVSPTGDLLARSDPPTGSVVLWDLTDPAKPLQGATFQPHVGQIFVAIFSPDGRTLIVGGGSPFVEIWDVSNPAQPTRMGHPLLTSNTVNVHALAISPDGQHLFTEGRDGSVSHWDLTDPQAPQRLGDLPGGAAVNGLDVSPSGDLLAVAGVVGLQLWDLTAAEPVLLVEFAPDGTRSTDVDFSNNGMLLAVGDENHSVTIRDVSAPQDPIVLDADIVGPESQINAVQFSPDDSTLAVSASDHEVRFFDTGTWLPVQSFPHTGPATGIEFLPEGQTVVTSSTDGVTRIWPYPGPVLGGISGSLFTVDAADSGELFIGSSAPFNQVWDMTDPARPQRVGPALAGSESTGTFTGGGAIAPNGSVVGTVSNAGNLLLYGRNGPAYQLAGSTPAVSKRAGGSDFSSDSKIFAYGGNTHTLGLWDVSNPAAPEQLSVIEGISNSLYFVSISQDRKHLSAANISGQAMLWSIEDPRNPLLLAELDGLGESVFAVQFSPDGSLLAAGGIDGTVKIWNIQDPANPVSIGSTLVGAAGDVYWLSFTPDGTMLSVASTDGKGWLWNLSDPANPSVWATLSMPAGSMDTGVFMPSGDVFVAGGSGSQVHIWSIDIDRAIAMICDRQGDGITQAEWQLYIAELEYSPPCGT